MTKKTYRTYSLKGLALHFKDEDGKRLEIVFHSGIQVDSTAKYSTASEKIQSLLENAVGFGRDYYIESEIALAETAVAEPVVEKKAEKEPEEKPLTDVKDIRRFHNLVEMKNHMAELGFEGVHDMNYMAAKAAAAREGYDFQIQK